MTLRTPGWLEHVTAMKRWIFSGLIAVMALALTARAQEKFSQTVRPDDFAAAGLAKLTPEERARLDVLIEAYRGGTAASATAGADRLAAAEARAIKAEHEAEVAKAASAVAAKEKEKSKGEGGGFLARAKVFLKPGTEVEYERLETRLLGEFSGWQEGTIFVLENGQRWRAQSGSYNTPPEPGPRKVVIAPGMLGSFFLEIEGVKQKPKIKFIGGGK